MEISVFTTVGTSALTNLVRTGKNFNTDSEIKGNLLNEKKYSNFTIKFTYNNNNTINNNGSDDWINLNEYLKDANFSKALKAKSKVFSAETHSIEKLLEKEIGTVLEIELLKRIRNLILNENIDNVSDIISKLGIGKSIKITIHLISTYTILPSICALLIQKKIEDENTNVCINQFKDNTCYKFRTNNTDNKNKQQLYKDTILEINKIIDKQSFSFNIVSKIKIIEDLSIFHLPSFDNIGQYNLEEYIVSNMKDTIPIMLTTGGYKDLTSICKSIQTRNINKIYKFSIFEDAEELWFDRDLLSDESYVFNRYVDFLTYTNNNLNDEEKNIYKEKLYSEKLLDNNWKTTNKLKLIENYVDKIVTLEDTVKGNLAEYLIIRHLISLENVKSKYKVYYGGGKNGFPQCYGKENQTIPDVVLEFKNEPLKSIMIEVKPINFIICNCKKSNIDKIFEQMNSRISYTISKGKNVTKYILITYQSNNLLFEDDKLIQINNYLANRINNNIFIWIHCHGNIFTNNNLKKFHAGDIKVDIDINKII